MDSKFLYDKSPRYYDVVYYWKDYKVEAEKLKKLISRYKKSKGKSLLDVACGTGEHIKYLKNIFNCVGADLNPKFIAIARKKAPGVRFIVSDMRKMNLKNKFDVITCLFSAIGHMLTAADFKKAINNFAAHLSSGGVVLIEPWFTRKTFIPKSAHLNVYDDPKLKIVRLTAPRRQGELSVLDEHFLVANGKKKVAYFRDIIKLRMTEKVEFLSVMKNAGLKASFLPISLTSSPHRRGVYVGVKN